MCGRRSVAPASKAMTPASVRFTTVGRKCSVSSRFALNDSRTARETNRILTCCSSCTFLFPAALSSALAKNPYNISSANLPVRYIDPLFTYQYSFIHLTRSGKQRAFSELAGCERETVHFGNGSSIVTLVVVEMGHTTFSLLDFPRNLKIPPWQLLGGPR